MVDNTESLIGTAGTIRVLLERWMIVIVSYSQEVGTIPIIKKSIQSFLYCFFMRA